MSSQSYSHEGDAMNRFRLPEINDSYSLRAVSDSKGYFLRFCSLLSSLAAFTLALVCVVHIICLLVITNFSDALGVYETAYRLYGLSFAIIGVMCEMEWTETIRTTSLLQFWTSRGFFYIFVALFTVREYGEVTLPLGLKNLNRVVLFVGGVLATTGVLYAVMGMFCLKKIRDQKMARYLRMLSGIEASSSFELISSVRPEYGSTHT